MRKQMPSIIVGMILAVILGLYMVTFQVRTTEVAIKKTFGRADADDVITEPGFQWKWPIPVQQVVKFDTRIRVFNDTFEETTTGDKKNLILTVYVAWKVADPLRLLQTDKSEKEVERELKGIVRHHKTAVIGQFEFSNFVSSDPDELKFDEIERNILQLVQVEAREKYGVEVVTLGIRKLMLPKNITTAVFDRMKKTRQKDAQRYRSEGKARADEIVAKAVSAREQILAFARREAQAIRAEGDRRAAESLASFKEDEWFANFLRTLDFFRSVLDTNTTAVLGFSPFDMFRKGPMETALRAPSPAELTRLSAADDESASMLRLEPTEAGGGE